MATPSTHPGQELAGKVALVTGAGQNIGRAIALDLARAGAAVAVNTRASREAAESVVREIQAAGGQAELCMADVADAGQVKQMVDGVIGRRGRIDILVLNASVRWEMRFTEMSFEQWRVPLSISLDGSFHCIKACLPSMLAAGGGSIVALTGSNVLTGAVGKVHSSAAKSGLTGMIRALARELGQQGIRANCVSPGMINTTRPDYRAPRRDPRGLIPLERRGESEEIAAAVRFLCGPGASYITGQTIHVNGGQTMF
ncbi:MAG: SDR family oxidoreductase [Betaproteobacteria bacterium]|nr:SDR family oxidoreductase [Betaproteobacteria bacterium]